MDKIVEKKIYETSVCAVAIGYYRNAVNTESRTGRNLCV